MQHIIKAMCQHAKVAGVHLFIYSKLIQKLWYLVCSHFAVYIFQYFFFYYFLTRTVIAGVLHMYCHLLLSESATVVTVPIMQ